MENTDKRIPFDWEKYQSGEYTPICRNGDKPEQIAYNPNAKESKRIAMWIQSELYSRCEDGTTWADRELDYDLFLIPKTKKFQAWVNLYSDGLSLTYRSEYMAKELVNIHLENGREFIETRLIEWEG
jgi:hypothetical protein